jgi:TonB-linked SusC/RagA family outer membrane protein
MHYCYSKKCFTGIIILMLILAKTSYAAIQDTTARAVKTAELVNGTVVDENNRPINGATVSVKGKTTSVQTNISGYFELAAMPGDVLVFTYTNHYVSEIEVKTSADKLTVRLLDRYLQTRNQVDVLYGSVNTESQLASVATIYTNQITTTPATLYVYALPGQLAGLYTQQSSGFTTPNNTNPLGSFFGNYTLISNTASGHATEPSDNTEMALEVRGNGQGVTTVIDGVQEDISSIDPESIESISVLKDALSTILLGINSSKPILLVTTRKAEIGAPRITFTTETAIQQSLGMPTDQVTAYQWAYLYNEALQNAGLPVAYSTADLNAYKNHTDPYGHPDVDWNKLLLNDYSPLTSDKLNVSGGTDVARYTISLDYLDQGGIFKEAPSVDYSTDNNLSRYTLNSTIDVSVNKNLSIALQLYGKVEEITEPGTGYNSILSGIETTPNNAYPVYNPDGSFGGSSLGSPFTNNLLSMAQYSGYQLTKIHDVLSNLDVNYKLDGITKGLSFKAKANVVIESQVLIDRSFQNNAYSYLKTDSTITYNAVGSTTSESNAFSSSLSSRISFEQASLNYDKQFGKNTINAQAFYDTRSLSLSYDLPAVTVDRAVKGSYNYDGKYFAEGALNYSGFNQFPPGHQNGFFYAGGLGWQMGKEDFMKDIDWLTSWKWRATFGQTGNNSDAGYYTYKQAYTSGGSGYAFGIGHPGTAGGYEEITPIANPNESWERAHKLDIGADISFFENHLQLTADYYHELYYDLLGQRGASIALLGTTYPLENIDRTLYTGEELSITYQNHIDNLNYFITANGSIAHSKLVYFDEETPKYPWNAHTGLPLTAIFGYKAEGYYTAQDFANGHTPAAINGYTPQPGDIKYADLNGDGVIDQYDQTAIGGLKPLVYYGISMGANYKGFSVSIIIQGVFNRQIDINNAIFNGFQGANSFDGVIPVAPWGQAYQNVLNRWTPETAATAAFPRLILGDTNTEQTSSYDIKSGDYVRLKNAEIGYTLPLAFSKKLKLSGIRVFVNGENLFTIAGYQGFPGMDPEVNGVGAYPIQRVVNAGLTVKL